VTKVDLALEGVPETLLWTLHHRAVEARRRDAVLDDPLAIELVEHIDYPFERRFGARAWLGQWQALRARCFDREIRRFLSAHPDGTVVALGEGLETQFWRVDNARVTWVSVDLPESIAARQRLLPHGERQRELACSALDTGGWMGEADAGRGLLLTAQGLLMHFRREEVHGLLRACAERFPGSDLVFDAVPAWATRIQPPPMDDGYVPPRWTWGLDRSEERALSSLGELRPLRLPRGRGLLGGFLLPLASGIAPLRRRLLSIHRLSFR
jgi:O-methyltransferase involved in polyketide biosynthesis